VRKYIKAHDGLLLANHGALTIGSDVYAAYYKMETIEHFAKISLVTRQLGREHLLSREEVLRLQDLRGNYGIKAPAPICADGPTAEASDPASCQIVEAPASRGARLVPTDPTDLDGEIRLSYRELTALIEDAVKALLGGQHG
jgi:L-fuculose-phosphate aldolase